MVLKSNIAGSDVEDDEEEEQEGSSFFATRTNCIL